LLTCGNVDSLVSSHVYEIIRTIYTTPGTDTTDNARVSVLQQTLSQLRLTNIATLDACMNHFTRLIDLTSADETYVAALATALAPCILRPRQETSLTLEEKHAYRLIRDLFTHKDAIFSELKRMSTLSHSTSIATPARPRAISTDESNRKAHMEERTRALLEKASGSRSRATSPAPSPRGHRRERSTGGPETRFPIQTIPNANRQSIGSLAALKRSSLEVPGSFEASTGTPEPINGGEVRGRTDGSERDSLIEKRNSLGRSGARFVSGRRVQPSTPSTAEAPRGVTLEDRPMDD
jgi:hypothetical protein